MGDESIRFFLRNGRIWVRGGEYADSVDLGPEAEVGEAMVRFFEERTAPGYRGEDEPGEDRAPRPETSSPPLRTTLPRSPVAPEPPPPRDPAHRTAVGRNEIRHELTIQGRIVANSGAREVTVLDLSESGCRFADRYRGLNPGDTITIKIGPIGPVRATVRWCRGGYVGIAFENPLYPSVLEHIRDHFNIRK